MRDRTSLLLELIKNPQTVDLVLAELSEHGWFCEEHLAIVTKQDVLDIFKQFLNDNFTVAEITNWANAIGGRPDVGFEFGPDGVVEESLYWLAHPEINLPLDRVLYEKIVSLYERRKARRQ